MCYYFDDIMEVKDINIDNFLLDKRSYKNILIYKKLMDEKPLRVIFYKVDRIIKIHDGIRYLELWYLL